MNRNTHCRNGHELTPGNIRSRADRPDARDCLTCYRDAIEHRGSQAGKPTDPLRNRARMVRNRAKLMGLAMTQRRTMITIADERGTRLFTGALDEAEQWMNERFVAESPGPEQEPPPPNWAPWLDLFTKEQHAAKRSPGTVRLRVHHLSRFGRQRDDLDPMTVGRSDLIDYMAEYAEDWTPRMAHSVRTSFRVFFSMLYELEHRRDNPARTLPAIKIPRSVPRPAPDHAILQAYAAAESDPRLRLALQVMVETGMRRAEVSKVRPVDVLGRTGDFILHVVGKGGHERLIPVTDELANEILACRSEWLFESKPGVPLTPGHLGKLIVDALPGQWTAHTLRHRFATMAYQGTGDLRAVQELMGHASPTTTAIYTKVSDDSMRRAAQAAAL